MKTHATTVEDEAMVECGCCDAGRMRRGTSRVTFAYGEGLGQVDLEVDVPVLSCDECDFGYEDEGAEDVRHEAVCRHLGRLTPQEIREFRRGIGLTQQQLADLTELGIASIKRWETGNQIQSPFVDRVLRVLEDGRALAAMRDVAGRKAASPGRPRFRTDLPPRSFGEAARFRLRPQSSRDVMEAA